MSNVGRDKIRVAYVILHYNTLNDTNECLDKIFKYTDLEKVELKVIIVDNASPNGSGEVLKKQYKDNKRVTVIIAKENLGFARGNNLGFKYAKENFDPEFILMCNNDTEIRGGEIYEEVKKAYKKYGFAVMGPRELLPDGSYYPLNMAMPTVEVLKKKIKQYKRNVWIYRWHLENVYERLVKKFPRLYFEENNECLDNEKVHKNIVLHGAFLIFSKKYIDLFDGLDPRTFLYCEEYLLALRLKKNGLISIYDPGVTILHKKGRATESVAKNERAKKIQRWKMEMRSLEILCKELEK